MNFWMVLFQLRDGGSIDSPVVGTFCGTTLPDVYISTANQIHLEFHTDWSSTGQGFFLNWEATSDYPVTTLPPTASTTPGKWLFSLLYNHCRVTALGDRKIICSCEVFIVLACLHCLFSEALTFLLERL